MTIKYRLALDLGPTSLGWAVFRLNEEYRPTAIIRAGVRIFSDGRNPKDGSSLAVSRRMARAMRRRRDRLLRRKQRMINLLIEHGFFPEDENERKALERLNPYELRARGLDESLQPEEFARALFHINQRRGFKSNRKTDRGDSEAGIVKQAISVLHQQIDPEQKDGKARTVGELLWRRMQNGLGVRARYREEKRATSDGKNRIEKSYDLYIDRALVEAEFDALWTRQAAFNPTLFSEQARKDLKDCLLYQRPLKPVRPGRCTLEPQEPRAPLALPSQQRFRIYQEVNNLRFLDEHLQDHSLTIQQRDQVVRELEKSGQVKFSRIRRLLGLSDAVQFNLEDAKRQGLKGNATSATLGKKEFFGIQWFALSPDEQDQVVEKLLTEESENALIEWLQATYGFDEARAEAIANVRLAEGYGNLSGKALKRILPTLQREVITYDKAVQAAGYDHHSALSHAQRTGEVLQELPYYGEYLQRHVGFGSGDEKDPPEKRFGKIANPTVHIGLNQIRVVVNALIKCYGLPTEVVVEVARELKQSHEKRLEENRRQAENQKRNERLRRTAAEVLGITEERVSRTDIQKLILWEELSYDVAERRCPYSGVQLSLHMVLSDEVEIEHILPFSMTLDDSLNNKTLATRHANRVKGNRTPYEARHDFEREGWHYEDMLLRATMMPKAKRYRFPEDGYQKWLSDEKDFLARALNDTRYLSRIAREYLSLICPTGTRVIPGNLTAMLRGRFGLNDILGEDGAKNRNDHRHHAVDACVIGVTDQGLLQRFSEASARTREKGLDRLVESMPLPWASYREHVERALRSIWVSHKPDHGYEGAIMEDTAYGIRRDGSIRQKVKGDGDSRREVKNLILISEPSQPLRHGMNADGNPLPYKGYIGGNNYCIEITRAENGKWIGEVIPRFRAYQIVREHGFKRLRDPALGQNGNPLVMRLVINDPVRMEIDGREQTMRMVKVAASGQIWFAPIHEANVDARNKDKSDPFSYTSKRAGSLQKARARRVSISPIGVLKDPGFKE